MSGRTLRNGPGAALQTNPDRLFKTLQSTRRRLVLAELVERNEPLALTALAESLVEALHDADDVHRVAVRLRHVDLPKLEAAGLVEYDHDERSVALTDGGASAAALTERPPDDQ
jgi:hypothetical protein